MSSIDFTSYYCYRRVNDQMHSFVRLETSGGLVVLVTPEHLVQAGVCAPNTLLEFARAADITPGMCVLTVSGREEIVSSRSEQVRFPPWMLYSSPLACD